MESGRDRAGVKAGSPRASPVLTAYDEEHAVTYMRDDWHEVARIVLHMVLSLSPIGRGGPWRATSPASNGRRQTRVMDHRDWV
jgi:hypothetical protein